MDRARASDLRAGQAYWLVDLIYAGRTWRLSTDDVVVPLADGTEIQYHGGIVGIDVSERMQIAESTADAGSVQVEVIMPCNVAQLTARGHELAQGRATVSRWVDGTMYEDRRPVLEGLVADPVYGEPNEPIAFSVTEYAWESTTTIPRPSQRVDGTTWSTATTLDEEALGLPYPLVIGHPGVVSTSVDDDGYITGTMAVWVDQTATAAGGGAVSGLRVVLAGHHVGVQRLYMLTPRYLTWTRFIVQNGYDDLKQPVAYVDAYADSGATVFSISDFDAAASYGLGAAGISVGFSAPDGEGPFDVLHVAWQDDEDATRGGLQIDGRTERRLGRVLTWLLGQLDRPVDTGRCQAAAPMLDGYQIDAVIDAQTQLWQWIQQHILTVFPVSVVSGPQGLYIIPIMLDAQQYTAPVTIRADDDPLVSRASAIEVDTGDLVNEVTVRYALSRLNGDTLGSVTLDYENSYHCRLSRDRYRDPRGLPVTRPMEVVSPIVYDDATATRLAESLAALRCLPPYRVTYTMPERGYSAIQRGTVVRLIDSLVSLDQVCQVEDVAGPDDTGRISVALIWRVDPLRDRQAP